MLHRGKTNKIQKITSGGSSSSDIAADIILRSMKKRRICCSHFLDRFLQSVPVYKMECTMEEEAAKTAYFCMKGEEK